jgi:hypothetical protein
VLEGGLAAGGILVLAGLALVAWAVERWRHAEFGSLNVQVTMRQVIPAVTLVSLGVQTLFASFFLGVLGLGRRA